MPKHQALVSIRRSFQLGKADDGLQIDVWADDDKLGRLEVSKATVRWYPKGVSANPITRSWSQFRDWMESES